MAAGMVSGAAALMIQNDSTLTPNQIKARLMKTAFKQLPRYVTVIDGGATLTSKLTCLPSEPDILTSRRRSQTRTKLRV